MSSMLTTYTHKLHVDMSLPFDSQLPSISVSVYTASKLLPLVPKVVQASQTRVLVVAEPTFSWFLECVRTP